MNLIAETKSIKRLELSRQAYLGGMVVILLLAAAMRFYLLTADAPLYLTRSQELNTDGPNTIGFARDWVLFGSQPAPYVQPALSWLAYICFSVLGIGYWQANFMAVITSLLAITFIAAFAHEQFGRRVALFSAFLMALNFPYLIYNRTPMVYTPLTCGLALALYCWGRGLRRPLWFLISGMVALFSVIFIKIAGITFLAAALVGLLFLTWQRWRQQQPQPWTPLLLFFIGGAVVAGIAWLYLFRASTVEIILPYDVSNRTFNPDFGLEENVRFAMVSVLQFGIYSGFFTRLFPLFALVYGYAFFRGIQLLGAKRPGLAAAEMVTLLYFGFTILMLLASNTLPFRFMIALIPPMSLIAALALGAWLRLDRVPLSARFNRLQLIFILMGLTYFIYQSLAALLKTGNTLRLGTSLIDYRVILDLPILFTLLIIALFAAMAGILAFVWWVGSGKRVQLTLPQYARRSSIALLIVVGLVAGDIYQYFAWAADPRFSIIEASHQISQDVGQDAVVGGPYAYILALESDLPAITFYTYDASGPPGVLDPKITHIAVDADSILKDAPFNEEGMYKIYPEAMKHARLLKSYTLRGYLVNLYEIERQLSDQR